MVKFEDELSGDVSSIHDGTAVLTLRIGPDTLAILEEDLPNLHALIVEFEERLREGGA